MYQELTDYNLALGKDLMLEINDTHQAVFPKAQFFEWLCEVNGWHHDPNTQLLSIIGDSVIFDAYRDEFNELTTARPIRGYDYFLASLRTNERMEIFQDFVDVADLDWVQVAEESTDDYDAATEALRDFHAAAL